MAPPKRLLLSIY